MRYWKRHQEEQETGWHAKIACLYSHSDHLETFPTGGLSSCHTCGPHPRGLFIKVEWSPSRREAQNLKNCVLGT
jgi:hypothetical protein